MERIEGLQELLEANFGLLREEEVKEIVMKLLKKYERKEKSYQVAKEFRKELRRLLEQKDPKRVLCYIDKKEK
jgi:hypothetical protein